MTPNNTIIPTLQIIDGSVNNGTLHFSFWDYMLSGSGHAGRGL